MPTFYEQLKAYDESKEVEKELDELRAKYTGASVNEFGLWCRIRELENKLQELIDTVNSERD